MYTLNIYTHNIYIYTKWGLTSTMTRHQLRHFRFSLSKCTNRLNASENSLFHLIFFYRLNRKQSIFWLCAYHGMNKKTFSLKIIRSSIIFMNWNSSWVETSERMCIWRFLLLKKNPRKKTVLVHTHKRWFFFFFDGRCSDWRGSAKG